MPAIPFLDNPLREGELAIRDAGERDIPEVLIAHQDDRELHRRLGLSRPPSGAELGRWMEAEAQARASGEHATFTIIADGEDRCRGQIVVEQLDWERGSGKLCVWVIPQVREREWEPRAARMLAGWLERVCGLGQIEVSR